MSSPSHDGRRLHPRYQVKNIVGYLRYPFSDSQKKITVQIVEVAKDSVVCNIPDDISLPVGIEIDLELSHPSQINLRGIVSSCFRKEKFTRLGLRFTQDMDLLSRFKLSDLIPSEDQRKNSRRSTEFEPTGKREFERRGLWPGLLSKRWLSNYASKLQNKNEYFFLTSLQASSGAHVTADGKDMIMMSSNNYLGLSSHPKLQEAALVAIKKYGSGAGASAILGGLFDIHLELEEELAKFEGVEAACIFNSGYIANMTTLMTILHKDDAVFDDELNHASLLDGSRLSGAKFWPFRHRDTKDLDAKLVKSKAAHKLVVIDGVFSMDGDIAPMPEIYRICKKRKAALMIDEAHATGVFGKNGRGLLEHYDIQGKADIIIGTMSKSLAASGGFIAGTRELIKILKHTARGAVFTTQISPAVCGVALAALKLISEEPERRQTLWRNTYHLRDGLKDMGFDTGTTQSPIIPVLFPTERETMRATRILRDSGVFVCPVIFPAVKKNRTRVRLSTMATHTDQDIEKVLSVFKKIKGL